MMGTMMRNWWTTIFGILAAVGQYSVQVGTKAPETKADWISVVSALVLAALGFVAKDASTGSAPK